MLTIVETSSASYAPRTYFNARAADATVAFAMDASTRGELLTKKAAAERYLFVPLDLARSPVEAAREVYRHAAKRLSARSLNIAGNGIYTLAQYGVQQAPLNAWVYEVLRTVHQYHRIERIYTGGQTGVDLAGAVAAVALAIDCTVTFPKGFIQRGVDKVDRAHTRDEIHAMITRQALALTDPERASVPPRPDSMEPTF